MNALRDLHLVLSMNILPIWVVMKPCVIPLLMKYLSTSARSLRMSSGMIWTVAPQDRHECRSIMHASKP